MFFLATAQFEQTIVKGWTQYCMWYGKQAVTQEHAENDTVHVHTTDKYFLVWVLMNSQKAESHIITIDILLSWMVFIQTCSLNVKKYQSLIPFIPFNAYITTVHMAHSCCREGTHETYLIWHQKLVGLQFVYMSYLASTQCNNNNNNINYRKFSLRF